MHPSPIFIALGSNHHPQAHLAQAQAILERWFPDISFTQSIRTKAIGDICHDDFINCIAMAHSHLDAERITQHLKELERMCGDDKEVRKQGKVLMDADLLWCQGHIYHTADWQRSYIQHLFNELCATAPTEVSGIIRAQYQRKV